MVEFREKLPLILLQIFNGAEFLDILYTVNLVILQDQTRTDRVKV
jgi:hypothetical protein